MSDHQEFYAVHCQAQFESGKEERKEILDAVGEINKKVFNGFGKSIDAVDDKVGRLRTIVLGTAAAVGIAVLAVVGDLVYDNIRHADETVELPPAIVLQLEELLSRAE